VGHQLELVEHDVQHVAGSQPVRLSGHLHTDIIQ
jgi:hypothetical protein